MINSSIYECTVMHSRRELTENKFYYRYFMFFIDLDEIDTLASKLSLFSRNRFNVFSFRDRDHLAFEKPGVKENILRYLEENGVKEKIGRIMLLTNVATFGYNFNPVSFYFCYDNEGTPLCVVPEVGNTFGELKPFFIGKEDFNGERFTSRMQKNFYVSPFIQHDVYFDFRLTPPNEKLNIEIDDYKENRKIFITRLNGQKKPLTDLNLFIYSLKYPLVTVKVIAAIHWQAVKLLIKKIPYFRKNEFLELQKGAIEKWKSH